MQAKFPYKIAFFIPQIGGGGAERVVANLVNQIADNGVPVILITKKKKAGEYPLSSQVNRCYIDSKNSKFGVINKLNHVKELRDICKSKKIDVVVSFIKPANYIATFATLGIHTKHILSVRNAPEFLYPSLVSKFFAKMLFPLADGAVFQTPDAQAWFPSKLQKKSSIIFNPVKSSFYFCKRQPVKNRVVTCGRLTKQKNHEMLIRSFRNVLDKVNDAELYIYGEGPLESFLKSLIDKLNLNKNVFLKGRVSEVPYVLSQASLFVLSSDVEGTPNALMEAMAMGIPSISTDCPCGGPKMLLNFSGAGVLVPIKDHTKLADSIISLLSSPELCNEMGKKAKIKSADFQEEVIYKQWLNFIFSICS